VAADRHLAPARNELAEAIATERAIAGRLTELELLRGAAVDRHSGPREIPMLP
jgi:hypothetical protein